MSSLPAKRTKIAAACNSCKRRKTRCDGQSLCSQCSRIGIECVYEDSTQRSRQVRFIQEDPRPAATQRPVSTNVERRLPDEPRTIAISADHLKSIEDRLSRLTSLVASIQQEHQETPADYFAGRVQTPEVRAVPQESSSNGYLAFQTAGRTRYVEPTFWASICNQVSEIDDLLSRQNEYIIHATSEMISHLQVSPEHERSATNSDTIVDSLRTPRGTDLNPSVSSSNEGMGDLFQSFMPSRSRISLFRHYVPSILSQLPSKPVCDFLIYIYFTSYHPLMPLLPSAEFKRRYDILWSQIDHVRDLDASIVAYLPLVIAVLFAGAAICPQDDLDRVTGSSPPGTPAASLYGLSTKVLRLASFPETPTIESLTAFLICHMTMCREEEPLAGCAWVGLTVRVAHVLGLHRDPGHFKFPQIIAETRRRIWWHVLHIDNDVSIASGTPLMVDLSLSDVAFTREMSEDVDARIIDDMVDEEILQPRNSSSVQAGVPIHFMCFDTPQGVYLAGKIMVIRTTHNILAMILRRSEPARVTTQRLVDILIDLEKDLDDRVKRLQDWALKLPQEDGEEISMLDAALGKRRSFVNWAQLLLPALRGRCWSIAQRVFPPELTDLRERVKEECRKSLCSLVLICGREEFRWYQWLWPVIHQPLHGIMVLIEDVNSNPDRSRASISQSAVEAVFAFCSATRGMSGTCSNYSANHRLSGNGQEAWVYIGRRRRTVWNARGFDPDERWKREEAITFAEKYLAGAPTHGAEHPPTVNVDIHSGSGATTGEPVTTGFSPLYSGAELDSTLWSFPFGSLDIDDLEMFE